MDADQRGRLEDILAAGRLIASYVRDTSQETPEMVSILEEYFST